jgi:hypothetical protein
MNVLREEGNRFDFKEDLSKIITSLEENNTLLKERMNSFGTMNNEFDAELGARKQTGYVQDFFEDNEETLTEDFYEELNMVDHIGEDEPEEENASETSWTEPSWEDSLAALLEPEVGANAVETKADTLEFSTDTVETIVEPTKKEAMDTDDVLNALLNNIGAIQEVNTETVQEVNTEIVQEEIAATESPAIVPLYADPNKALTADEIAALFASFGQ